MIKKTPLLILVLAAVAALSILAGCGGDSGSSSSDPASLAPAKSPLYLEATVLPSGKLKTDIDDLASTVAGIDNVGDEIVSLLETSASESGDSVDFDKEIKPWLGEKAGMSFQSYDGEDFKHFAVAIQSKDSDAALEFIEKHADDDGEAPEEGEYEGNQYFVEADDDSVVGVVGDFVVAAEDKQGFEGAVDAADGENLAESDSFSAALDNATPDSLADVFVDIGALIEQSGGDIDPQAEQLFESTGIEPEDATAVASLVPGSDRVEIDVSSDLANTEAPQGDASQLLGSLPDDSFAAVGVPGLGGSLKSVIDTIDENGIPGEVPPNQLKSTLSAAGIDLDKIASSIDDAAGFAIGKDEKSLEGALVLTTDNADQATETVTSVGDLLRASGMPGVTPFKGGFKVSSPDLGNKSLVVAARDKRIAISYGLVPAALALTPPKATLADDPTYKEAVSALEGTPISGFVDGPAALSLVEAMLDPDEKAEFEEAKPYVQKISYISIGSTTEGDIASARLIVGVGK
jgi:hypothetical protein